MGSYSRALSYTPLNTQITAICVNICRSKLGSPQSLRGVIEWERQLGQKARTEFPGGRGGAGPKPDSSRPQRSLNHVLSFPVC